MANGLESKDTTDREVVITRLLNTPRELVWLAYTDPKHIIKWWGPNGFTLTINSIEIKPGGVWDFIMHGPDGRDYPNYIEFIDVVKPERISHWHGSSSKGDTENRFYAEVTFEERGEKTLLTMRTVLPSKERLEYLVKNHNVVEGAKQNVDKLEVHLAAMQSGDASKEFVISRTINAPRNLVWEVFTDPKHLMHWWGPKELTMKTADVDLRPGGIFHYSMEVPGGNGEMWGKFAYWEIVKPERIVFVNSFSDKDAGTTRHPMAPDWPLEMLNTLTLTERDGKTILTLKGCPINATAEERKVYFDNFPSMEQGFGGTFDQLDEYLAIISKQPFN